MTTASIQDRTPEFRSILALAQRRQATTKVSSQRQQLLSNSQQNGARPTKRQRSEFARKAAEVGRGIAAAMGKLERLAQLAKRKTLFDDRPTEINELTYVIKQDLAGLNNEIKKLEMITKSQHPQAGAGKNADQEGEHNNNVAVLLQKSLADVSVNFKEVLEVRNKNLQESKDRQQQFVSNISAHSQPSTLDPARTESPLYSTPQRGRSPKPGYSNNNNNNGAGQDLLTLEPPTSSSSSALARTSGAQSEQQLMLMEEGSSSNAYIAQRGEAIEGIERTIAELGGIFGQLAQMVSEQSDMIQRIDANTEDVVDNVEGAQMELMKYWGRVSGSRWLIAKMFGVLMVFFLLWVLIAG
ncbi:Integral membrane protein SED5 [Elasticomyces elasticus]|nr:Integral membrane protein SED5 [Elasticomyces elasticus]